VGGVPADGIHHGEDVVVALLECRRLVEAIRHADPALVEVHAGHVLAEVFVGSTVRLVLPGDLAVRDQVRDDHQRRPVAPLLVREP
jgi:hypothetical protein